MDSIPFSKAGFHLRISLFQTRDWNEELQTTRELPRKNLPERLLRERAIFKVILGQGFGKHSKVLPYFTLLPAQHNALSSSLGLGFLVTPHKHRCFPFSFKLRAGICIQTSLPSCADCKAMCSLSLALVASCEAGLS